MRLTTVTAPFFSAVLVASGIFAQSPSEKGVPTTGSPAVTYPSTDAFIFCSAPGCTGTCDVVLTSAYPSDDTHPSPIGFQSIYWYDPGGYNIQLYTCLDECLVRTNPIEITKPNTCYNLYNNSVPTDFYTFYYYQGPI